MSRDDRPPGLLFGAASVTGFAIARLAGGRLEPVCGPHHRAAPARGFHALPLESDEAVRAFLSARPEPALVIYAHAVCDVPACEANPDWAREVNVANLERVLSALPGTTRFVYVSSDHVFPGEGEYLETDPPAPRSVYGRTRVAAERLVLGRPGSLVVRTGLAVGPSPDGRSGHLDWLLHRTDRGLPVTIVRDEIRSVYPAETLAERILALARSEVTGLRHLSAVEELSRPELARRLLRLHGRRAAFAVIGRDEAPAPHPGRLVLRSIHTDELAEPLPGIPDRLRRDGRRHRASVL